MRDPKHDPTSSQDAKEPQNAHSNRYVLIAALAAVALVTVYLIKTNLEPPKAPQNQAQIGAEQPPSDSATAMMQDVEQQIGHIKGILAKDTTNYDAWVALGNIYFDANKPEEAIPYYEGALRLKPDDAGVLTDMATMKRALGKSDEAVALLKKVVAKDSTMGQAWFNLGVIYSFDLKNQKDAIAAWKRYLDLNPMSEHAQAVQKAIDSLERTLK